MSASAERVRRLRGVHMDGMSLVPLLDGGPLAALAEDSAVIKTASGGTLTYRKHGSPPAGRCLIWELPA